MRRERMWALCLLILMASIPQAHGQRDSTRTAQDLEWVRVSNHVFGYEFSVPNGSHLEEWGDCFRPGSSSRYHQAVYAPDPETKAGHIFMLTVIPGAENPECSSSLRQIELSDLRVINGIEFRRYRVLEVAAGQRWNEVSYAKLHRGNCFWFDVETDSEFNEPELFLQILSRVRFLE